jgi:hypothetical protein
MIASVASISVVRVTAVADPILLLDAMPESRFPRRLNRKLAAFGKKACRLQLAARSTPQKNFRYLGARRFERQWASFRRVFLPVRRP